MRNQDPAVLLRGLDVMQSLALYALPVGTGLVAIPGATEGYRVPKDAVAEAAILTFIAGWTLKHVWAADLMEALGALREVPCLTPLTCFVVWTIVTAFASPNPRFSSTVEVNIVLFFLLYALSYNEWNHARVRRWIALVTLAALLNGILMLLQRAKLPLGGYLSYEMSMPDRYRMAGFIGNPNDVGNYLVLAFLLTCAGALIARSWLPRVTCAIALLFLCVLVVWTETYTSIAALGAALLVSFALFAWMRPRLAFRVGSFVFLALLLGAAAARWQLSKNPESRRVLRATVSAARAGHWNEALHGRYFPWRITADMIDDRPFLGHGPGTFSYIFFDYQLRFKAAHPGVVTQREYFDQTHNDYLQIAAEMGTPSLLLLAWVAVSFLWNAGSALKRAEAHAPGRGHPASPASKGAKREASGLLSVQTVVPLLRISVLAAMLVGSLAGFPFRLAVTMSLFVPVASMNLSPVKERA